MLVIDEIGKMEFFSAPFKSRIKEIFSTSKSVVLATIPIRKGDPLIESIRNNKDAKVWLVSSYNSSLLLQKRDSYYCIIILSYTIPNIHNLLI